MNMWLKRHQSGCWWLTKKLVLWNSRWFSMSVSRLDQSVRTNYESEAVLTSNSLICFELIVPPIFLAIINIALGLMTTWTSHAEGRNWLQRSNLALQLTIWISWGSCNRAHLVKLSLVNGTRLSTPPLSPHCPGTKLQLSGLTRPQSTLMLNASMNLSTSICA